MTGKPSKRPPALTLFEFLAVVVSALVLYVCLLPLMGLRYETRRIPPCRYSLKQILLALHNYSDAYGSLPPAYTVDANGEPLHSWRTLILPYLDQGPLYRTIDLAKPWNHRANSAALNTALPIYRCPRSSNVPANHTTYLAIATPNGCFYRDKPRRLTDITDGLSQTLIVIEVPLDRTVPWMAPTDADEQLVIGIGPGSRLAHAGGVDVAMADGYVGFLSADTPRAHRRAKISIAGNEKFPEADE